jgi:hypothetical protein
MEDRGGGEEAQGYADLKKVRAHWSTLVYLGLPWSTLVYLGLPWSTLVYLGLPWSTLVYLGPQVPSNRMRSDIQQISADAQK